MATAKVILSVLDVGQGQGTFVEIYDKDGNLTNTLLFDLGSAKSRKIAGGPSIDYIVSKIELMDTPKIDFLSISHKDRDHRNLLMQLIDDCEEAVEPKDFYIDKCRYGGALEWYPKDLRTKLASVCKDLNHLQMKETGFKASNQTWTAIWSKNDVSVYINLANVPTDTKITLSKMGKMKPDSELANSVSILCSVAWNTTEFMINGDATFTTIQEFNNIFKDADKFTDIKMMTIPHHGSRKTNLGLSGSTSAASSESYEILEAFISKVNPKTAIASAETYGKYKHPSFDILNTFGKYTDTTKNWWSDPDLATDRHYATAFLDTEFQFSSTAQKKIPYKYFSFETSMNVFTTLYYDPESTQGNLGAFKAPPTTPVDPGTDFTKSKNKNPYFPQGARWQFTVKAYDKVSLLMEPNRDVELLKLAPKTTNSKVKKRSLSSAVKSPARTNEKLARKLKIQF